MAEKGVCVYAFFDFSICYHCLHNTCMCCDFTVMTLQNVEINDEIYEESAEKEELEITYRSFSIFTAHLLKKNRSLHTPFKPD